MAAQYRIMVSEPWSGGECTVSEAMPLRAAKDAIDARASAFRLSYPDLADFWVEIGDLYSELAVRHPDHPDRADAIAHYIFVDFGD